MLLDELIAQRAQDFALHITRVAEAGANEEEVRIETEKLSSASKVEQRP
jgi:hypothetical protein